MACHGLGEVEVHVPDALVLDDRASAAVRHIAAVQQKIVGELRVVIGLLLDDSKAERDEGALVGNVCNASGARRGRRGAEREL